MATKKANAEDAPVLDLSSDNPKPRRRVQIDGTKYELRWLEEFGFDEQAKFTREVAKLQLVSSLDEKGYAELRDNTINDAARAVDKSVKAVLIGLPAKTLDKLTFDQKMQILAVFNPAKEGKAETSGAEASDSPAGTQPYLASPDSTAGAGATG